MNRGLRIPALLAAWVSVTVQYAQTVITDFPWSADLQSEQPFTLVNGTEPNRWIWGDAAGNEAPCLHIGSDLTTGNDYWVGIDAWTAPFARSRVYAYIDLAIPEFHYAIDLAFDLRVGGGNGDDLQVLIMPAEVMPLPGLSSTSLGPGVENISSALSGIPAWQTMQYVLSPEYAGRTIRLAFHWRNNSDGGIQPGAAIDNIRVTTSPCIAPFGVAVSAITANTAAADWPPMPSAASFHYELRTSGAPGSGSTGLFDEETITTDQVLLEGLTPGTFYNLYLRTDCGDSLTTWSPAFPFVTDPVCGSTFTDPGGPSASYGPLVDRTYLICPPVTGRAARVAFTAMNLATGDRLEVYDGPEANGAPKAIITGTTVSTHVSDHYTGCLSFRFVSDGQWQGTGWQGTVTCAQRTGCTVWGVDVEQTATDAVQVRWHCTGAVMPFVVEHGAVGWTPGNYIWPGTDGTVTLADTAALVLEGLSPGTVYELEVRANCAVDGEYQDRSIVQRFQMATGCGHPFPDPGGELYNYPPYGSRVETICADDPDRAVSLTFSSFQLEPWYDVLYVFDGPDTSSPLFSSGNPAPLTTSDHGPGGWWGLTGIPGPFMSTHTSGCLTTAFISDDTVEYEGWSAQVDCGQVGIFEVGRSGSGFTTMPNPVYAGDALTLRLPPSLQGPLRLDLFNAAGDLQFSQAALQRSFDDHVLQLPPLASGLYTISVTDMKGTALHSRIIVL